MVFSLRKALCYTLPAGFWAQIVPVLTSFLLGLPIIMNAFYMLAINLVTDLYPTIALLIDPPETSKSAKDIKKERIIDRSLFLHGGAFIGSFEAFYAICMWFLFMQWYGNFSAGELLVSYENYNNGLNGKPKAKMQELDVSKSYIMSVYSN